MPPSAHRPYSDCSCGCAAGELSGVPPDSASAPLRDTRRGFLKRSAAAALAGLLGVQPALAQTGEPKARPATWARLITPFPQWSRHQPDDTFLTHFMLAAGLNVAPTVPTVVPSSLEALEGFSLLFANHLAAVTDEGEQANLREYLYRGGFIYVDGCNDNRVTPSYRVFHQQHLALFARMLPGSEVRLLSSAHPIFRTPFPVEEKALIPDAEPNNPKWAGARQALYGVFDDDHIVILFSQEHLRCSWSPDQGGWNPEIAAMKVRLAANIHAHGMRARGIGISY
jgi:Domain of unknown function (DUF4159)